MTTIFPKRSSGRPKGLKYKVKLHVGIMVDPEIFMKQLFIEISAGYDVAESIVKMTWCYQADISVLRGFGLGKNMELL